MKCSFRPSSLGDLACRKSFFYFSCESCSPSRLNITVCAFKMATQSKVHETVSWQMNTRASIYSQQRRIHSTTFTFSIRFLFFSLFFCSIAVLSSLKAPWSCALLLSLLCARGACHCALHSYNYSALNSLWEPKLTGRLRLNLRPRGLLLHVGSKL